MEDVKVEDANKEADQIVSDCMEEIDRLSNTLFIVARAQSSIPAVAVAALISAVATVAAQSKLDKERIKMLLACALDEIAEKVANQEAQKKEEKQL